LVPPRTIESSHGGHSHSSFARSFLLDQGRRASTVPCSHHARGEEGRASTAPSSGPQLGRWSGRPAAARHPVTLSVLRLRPSRGRGGRTCDRQSSRRLRRGGRRHGRSERRRSVGLDRHPGCRSSAKDRRSSAFAIPRPRHGFRTPRMPTYP
jgi:hypothetical protein